MLKARPFTKRPGGKGKLMPQLTPLIPITFRRYEEPFCGAAASFFWLRDHITEARLSDADPHIINALKVVRDDVEMLILALRRHSYDEHEFYDTRAWYNAGSGDAVERAAALVYLSKTCFNGIWRTNRKGELNTPWGRHDNPTICDADNLRACSAALQGIEIAHEDFSGCEARLHAGDFAFVDSPYLPEPGKSSFVAYTAGGFNAADHERLAEMLRRLAARGVHWLATNSDTPRTRELYAGFQVVSTSRGGGVNSDPTKRQRVPEVAILSGTWDASPSAKECA